MPTILLPSESNDTVVRTLSGARFTDTLKTRYRVSIKRCIRGCYLGGLVRLNGCVLRP